MKMIKNATTALVSIAAVVAMTACSSDSDTPFVSGKLATGGFTKVVGVSAGGGPIGDFHSSIPKIRIQYMYEASEIEGAGYITEVKLPYSLDSVADITCSEVTIKMAHTMVTDLGSPLANNVEQGAGTLETVLATGTIIFPAGSAGDRYTFALDTPFHYNGVDNLVVDIDRNGTCDGDFPDESTLSTPVTVAWTFDDDTSSSIGNWHANMDFTFAGGVNAQMFEVGASSDGTILSQSSRVQVINLAEDINGSGPITGLAYQVGALSTASEHNLTIRLGHTSLDSFTVGGTFEENYAGSSVMVAENTVLKMPAGLNVGDWFWIPLSGDFNYNGTDNLIVDVQGLSTATTPIFVQMFTPPADRLTYSMVGTQASPDGVFPGHHNIKLRFNGAPMSVVETNLMAYTVPLNASGSGTIAIYGAHVLGTGAAINSVSMRVAQDIATEVTYTDANITIGHTANIDLVSVLADNMDDATVVYTGDITIAAGTKAGDWVTIPVSGFTYDPTKNLIVQVNPGSGSADVLAYYSGNGVVSNIGAFTAGSTTINLGTEGTRHPQLQLGLSK